MQFQMAHEPQIRHLGYTCWSNDNTIAVVPSKSGLIAFACLGVVCIAVPAAVIWLAMRDPRIVLVAAVVGCVPVLVGYWLFRRELADGPAW
jgi:hypothetical protein